MRIIKNQKVLFGLILDPVCLLVISVTIFLARISLVNPLSPTDTCLHIFIDFALVYLFRILAGVYHQDWIKLPIYGILRVGVAEILACFAHYFFQVLVTAAVVPFIQILAIHTLNLIAIMGFRVLYFGIYRKKGSYVRILLSSPTMHEEEQDFIKEAFDKNWIAPLGFNCDGFENEIVKTLDCNMSALATVSGTSAIHLALKLAGVGKGDVVLCSDLTFSATVNPVCYEGATPVFIDSEDDTWNMDPEALERGFKKYPEAKAVVLVHLYGTPAKVDKIRNICSRHSAVLIEDAAEALGAKVGLRKCGTFGSYNILSFNGNKIITTSGGGMLLTDTPEAREKALFWSTQSKESAPWYQHEEIGYNYRMSNVVAGIGRGQLQHLQEHIDLKRAIYERYAEGFKDLPVKMNPYIGGTTPNFWLSCMTVNQEAMCKCSRGKDSSTWTKESGKTCPDEIAFVLRENGIDSRPIWKPMHMQPIFKDNDFISTGVGEDIFARGICLPSDIKMSREQQEMVIEAVRGCFGL